MRDDTKPSLGLRFLRVVTHRQLSLFDALCLGGVTGAAIGNGNPWICLLAVPLMMLSVALEAYANAR